MQRVSLETRVDCTHRDLAILRGLLDSRVATIHHLSTLYFEGRLEAARKRIHKLKTAGILHERPRHSTEPSIYCLNRRSIAVLNAHGVLADYPGVSWAHLEKRARVSELTLKHELAVMDIRAAMTVAVVEAGHTVAAFATWPKLFQFIASEPSKRDVLVKPDGFVRIQSGDAEQGSEFSFFLECDRSTETLDILGRRAACYRDFYVRGGFASRQGQPRSEFKKFPFVVLMVFKNAERRNNITEHLLNHYPTVRNQVWLSTMTEVTTDPLGAIWLKPGDYGRIVAGTPFDLEQRNAPAIYRRHPERDHFIEANVPKHRLLNVREQQR